MDKDIAMKWVEALRSGEYKQSGGKLRSVSGFCCLGVLCDLHSKEHNIDWVTDLVNEFEPHFYYQASSATPPKQVIQWSGLKSSAGFHDQRTKPSLIELNDKQEQTFAQIADFIEQNWEGL